MPIYVPQHKKTYLLTCAPEEDSYQPAHPGSLISDFFVSTNFEYLAFQNTPSENSEKSARMQCVREYMRACVCVNAVVVVVVVICCCCC